MRTLRRTVATVGVGLALGGAAIAASPSPDDIAGQPVLDVRAFGTSGDGITDDTERKQKHFACPRTEE